MISRDLKAECLQAAEQYPVVTLIGPRQSGKTTLVRASFPNKPYVNLEDPEIRLLATEDPRALLEKYPDGAILDEIQRAPELLSYIQVIVDEKDQRGMFILTGSHQLQFHEAITQSLAGRTALLNLLPLSLAELQKANIHLTTDEYLVNGLYPRIYRDKLEPQRAYRNYVQTYIERDVRQLINVKDLNLFQKFLKLCAGRIGQLINFDNISNELGVSGVTVKHWLSILEASYIIIRLQPYFENLGKRLVKTPKLYFVDVGLAAYLLDIETTSQMARDPLRGNLFENLVILELIKARYNKGLNHNLYFYRDNKKNEVDAIYKMASQLIPIEIKSAMTFSTSFAKGIEKFQSIAKDRCPGGYIVYGGEQSQSIGDLKLLNYHSASTIIDSER